MKYVLDVHLRPDLTRPSTRSSRQAASTRRSTTWFGEHGDKFADTGAELPGIETATTVKHGDDGPVVVDGPFNEAKEVVGGFSVIDVARHGRRRRVGEDLAASSSSRGVAVEIRPMVEDYSAVRVTPTAHSAGRTPRAHPARGVRPARRRGWPGSSATSTSPRRPSRARSPRRSRRGAARSAGQPAPPGCRPPRRTTPSTWCGGVPARTPSPTAHPLRRTTAARPTDERLALLFACCHPALAPEATAGADPARRRRPDHAADRAGVPGQRAHARPADRAGQAQDRLRPGSP